MRRTHGCVTVSCDALLLRFMSMGRLFGTKAKNLSMVRNKGKYGDMVVLDVLLKRFFVGFEQLPQRVQI